MSNISRVSTLQTSDNMLSYMLNAESKYNELSQEAASGIKINEPSDDPVATKKILKTTSKLNDLSMYSDSINNAESEIKTTSTTLDSVSDLVSKSTDYATQAANGTYSSDDLKSIKSQVDQILQGVLDYANTDYNGKYVFSGTATATKTYTTTTDASGNITAITYNGTAGSDYQRYSTISDGVAVPINVRGNDVFGSYSSTSSTTSAATGTVGVTASFGVDGSGNTTITTVRTVYNSVTSMYDTTTTNGTAIGLTGNLVTLSTALEVNDQTTVNSCITKLNKDLTAVTTANTKLASVQNRLELTSSSIDETVANLKSYKSDLQDADLTEVATDLATQKNALEASYSITSQLLSKTSLLNYM